MEQLHRSNQLPYHRPEVSHPGDRAGQAARPAKPHQRERQEPAFQRGDPRRRRGDHTRHHKEQDRHQRRLPEAQHLRHPAVQDHPVPVPHVPVRGVVLLVGLSLHRPRRGVRRGGKTLHHPQEHENVTGAVRQSGRPPDTDVPGASAVGKRELRGLWKTFPLFWCVWLLK